MRHSYYNQDKAGRPGSLPTSRLAPGQQRAVLAILRSKVPKRALTLTELERIAEWQAQVFLELAEIRSAPVPSALISELPRVHVERDVDLPATISGCTQWDSGRWLIVLNGTQPRTRQRFSLAHEFDHVVMHPFRELAFAGRPGMSAKAQAEYAADYFAACLLMPRPLVKSAWYDGTQRLSELARLFDVSPPAMARRLTHLGLTPRPSTSQDMTYQRGTPPLYPIRTLEAS